MGYHLQDLFDEHFKGVDSDKFIEGIRNFSHDRAVGKFSDFLNLCIEKFGEAEGEDYLVTVHGLLLRKYDDAAISVKDGIRSERINFLQEGTIQIKQ